jgi:hypothetical protein
MWDLEDSSIDHVPLLYHVSECLTTFIYNPIMQGPNIKAYKCCDIVKRILNLLVAANIMVGV